MRHFSSWWLMTPLQQRPRSAHFASTPCAPSLAPPQAFEPEKLAALVRWLPIEGWRIASAHSQYLRVCHWIDIGEPLRRNNKIHPRPRLPISSPCLCRPEGFGQPNHWHRPTALPAGSMKSSPPVFRLHGHRHPSFTDLGQNGWPWNILGTGIALDPRPVRPPARKGRVSRPDLTLYKF